MLHHNYRLFTVAATQENINTSSSISTEELWRRISHFYYSYGDVMYEHVSQLDHALQSGTLAYQDTKDPVLTIGAFLHDIGHLIEYERKGHDDFIDDREHEQIGYDYLLKEIGLNEERILNSILYHVEAKRYLCYVDTKYHDHLSASSQHTLKLQGGVFTEDEAKEFEKIPFYKDACSIRRFDDNAKLMEPEYVLDMNQMREIFFEAFDG